MKEENKTDTKRDLILVCPQPDYMALARCRGRKSEVERVGRKNIDYDFQTLEAQLKMLEVDYGSYTMLSSAKEVLLTN